ncbi:protein-disulfide reductase DsbD family protein [Plasticicumulans sp.]|uniref:protein-disulfide reductase DsbD family protein n=1 Tax=Plasticicumulans sp. TaxID=2307179 RepID=UPI0039490717
MFRRLSCCFALLLAAGGLAGATAQAAESEAVRSPRATVTLVADHDTVAPGQRLDFGLRQRLAPHWHTYWKNPGDAGSPPQIELQLPEGASAGPIRWPGPERMPVGPAQSFGYSDAIVLPFTVTVPAAARPGTRFTVEAEADWVVCEKECIPEQGRFRLELPVAATPVPAGGEVADSFRAAEARMPQAPAWPARLQAEGGALLLEVDGAASGGTIKDAFWFPATWGLIDHAAVQAVSADVWTGRLQLALVRGQAFSPQAALDGVLALRRTSGTTSWYALTPAHAAAAAASDAPAAAAGFAAWQAALYAFAGGLLLNLMPCVFPVLAIKAGALARLAGHGASAVRRSALAYTAGVLAALLALAGTLLALRAGGAALGWGFQFQSPPFVVLTLWLLFATGLNLSGVFEVGAGLAGRGQSLAGRPGHAGSFFTGLLAVVVATPCTAPFMAAALGAALAAPVPVALAIFVALGLGLALPYLLLALVPALAQRLPRPGAWMQRLREVLAFPMYAAAAWLLWVLAQLAGADALPVALGGALLIAFAGWLSGRAQSAGDGRGARIARGGALTAVLAAALLLPLLPAATPAGAPAAAGTTESAAEPYSAARLAGLRAAGRPVFVNLTAAWCITCLVNERTTLSSDTVRAAFAAGGVAYLKGDWTRRDAAIGAYLASFGRDGLPFYAFYPAGGGEPRLLPPVLSPALVVEAIGKPAAAPALVAR